MPEKNCSCCCDCSCNIIIFTAEAFAEGYAYVDSTVESANGAVVTSTSSASANSLISYNDAYTKAYALAKTYAENTDQYDANLISQTLDLVPIFTGTGPTGVTGSIGNTGVTGPTGFTGAASSVTGATGGFAYNEAFNWIAIGK